MIFIQKDTYALVESRAKERKTKDFGTVRIYIGKNPITKTMSVWLKNFKLK